MSSYPYKSLHIDYLQIGAHIGNSPYDPIYFKEIHNKTFILVEPVPFLYNMLKYNYKERIIQNEIDFLNIAVSDYDGTLELVAPSPNNDFNNYPDFLSQMASSNGNFIKRFKFDERFPDFKFEKIEVQCRRLNKIVSDRGITSIDHLIIDTEGHDFKILMDFDFSLVKPRKITFENCYTDEEGDLEKPNYKKLMAKLTDIGYSILEEDNSDTTVVLQ